MWGRRLTFSKYAHITGGSQFAAMIYVKTPSKIN